MNVNENREAIIDLLVNKAALKQDIADFSEDVFTWFKRMAQDELKKIGKSVNDKRVRLMYEDKGMYEFRVYIGSDALVFQLHSNVFRFDNDNPIWKSKYLEENGANGYFAVINIYNFLAESFERKRDNDVGYLIGRVFMNHDKHFMAEGKGQLGFLFRDLENGMLTDEIVRQIIQCSMTYSIEFDLLTPPYHMVQEVTLLHINAVRSDLQMATGKRLGFKFSADDNTLI